jgi:hypothetical protein
MSDTWGIFDKWSRGGYPSLCVVLGCWSEHVANSQCNKRLVTTK